MEELLKWYDENRELITVNAAEKEVRAPRGTLSYAIAKKRTLPKKFVQPLTILMDSLTAAPKKDTKQGKPSKGMTEKVATPKDEPVRIAKQAPLMLQHSRSTHKESVPSVSPSNGITRTETTASGLLVQYRDRYPTHNEKHGHNYTLIHDEGKGKPKTYFSGICYMKTGLHRPARFSFTLEDLK